MTDQSELILPAEAVEAVGDWLCGFATTTNAETDGRDRFDDAKGVIRAFCDAVGMEVERRIMLSELDPPVVPEWRYVSPWLPVEAHQ